MSDKRMLMIADADSFWTYRLLRYLLLPAGYQVTIFPIWGNHGKYADFYRDNGITVYEDRHTLPVIRHIPRLRMYVRAWLNAQSLRKLGPFEIVHNHYLSQRDLMLGRMVKRAFHAHWVASFWGSDLMRSSEKELLRMKSALRECDRITVHNQLNVEAIRKTYGEDIAKKTKLLFFGQTGYQDILDSRATQTREECRAHFGITPDRFVISIGYSASSVQRQLPVLQALGAMDEALLRRTTIILQQTYGENDPDYVKKTHEAAAALPCQTVILRDFMGPEESAMLRRSADVFILAIQTDAFSASMQEYLYGGAVVFKGSWLNYPQLEEKGIFLPTFTEYEELPAMLEKAAAGGYLPPSEAQREALRAENSWDAVRPDWLSLFPDSETSKRV